MSAFKHNIHFLNKIFLNCRTTLQVKNKKIYSLKSRNETSSKHVIKRYFI